MVVRRRICGLGEHSMRKRTAALAGSAAVLLVSNLTIPDLTIPDLAVAPAGAAPVGERRWLVEEAGASFRGSSPAIADVDGDAAADVVVGGVDGRLYAYDAAGDPLPGWGGGAPATDAIVSSPAVADLDADGAPEVAVGTGTVGPSSGSLDIFESDGTRRCRIVTGVGSLPNGTVNAPAVGDVDGDGSLDVVFASLDHRIRVVDADCRLKGVFNSRDTVFSAPALYDVHGDGAAEIFIGVDASRNPQTGGSHDGGYFRSLRYQPGYSHPDGHANLVQRWERRSRETFQSAPAIADLDGDGRPEAVTGSGAYWCRHHGQCADSAKVWAFHLDDGSDVPGWPRTASMDTTFMAAPAVGDIDGDGRLDVVVGTNGYEAARPDGGAVDAFYGDPGRPRSSWVVPDVEVLAPPVLADVDGGGTPEVLVAAGRQVTALGPGLAVVEAGIGRPPTVDRKASPAVGRLGDAWALVISGFLGSDGYVQAHDIAEPSSTPWPMHRKNPRRLGVDSTEPPLPSSGFHDVPDWSVYSEAVRWAAEAHITLGCAEELFCTGRDVTRAQAVTFLWRHAGEPAVDAQGFSDVDPDAYYATAVDWVRSEGITQGCTGSEFCPNGSATRAHLVTFLWRRAGRPDAGGGHGFTDVPPGAYYEQAVEWAVQEGITTGTSSTRFSPNVDVTRGQTILFLHRYDASLSP
jgi:hypothetical protein